jgi:dTDP-glucose 4,6-dehydratase/UDP-glucuronate decarboxylase
LGAVWRFTRNCALFDSIKSQFGEIIAEDVEIVLRKLGARLEALGGTTLLITGANGFLCSYFVDIVAALNDKGLYPACKVLALDNLRTGSRARLQHLKGRGDVRFIYHDISQPLALEKGVDWIIHGASIASPTFYRRYPLETIDVNVSGTRCLLELARRSRVKGMLYLSTSEIYGDPDPAFIPTPEGYRGLVSSTGPRACYDESKRLAETLCATYVRLYDLPVKIVRPFNVYGPGQPLCDGRIIPDLMKAALKRDPIVLFSDGRATRAFCYVTDAVHAMWHVLLAAAPGEIFNIGNDEREISIAELAREMRVVAGPPWLEIENRTSRDMQYLTDNPQRRCPDLRKLRGAFDWQPHVPLREGLSRTLRSYTEQVTSSHNGSKA